MKRIIIVAVAVLAAVMGVSVSAQAAGHTVVHNIKPTNRYRELIEPGHQIIASYHGTDCHRESAIVQGANRCFAGNYIYDPCWPTFNANGTSNGRFCPAEPWSTAGYKLYGGYTYYTGHGRTMWGLQNQAARKFVRGDGALSWFHNKPILWYSGQKGLVGNPYTGRPRWRITEVTSRNGAYRDPHRVIITNAWFART